MRSAGDGRRGWKVVAVACLVVAGRFGGAQVVSAPGATTVVATSAFSVVRIRLSPESEADDWGTGFHGRNFWAVHVTLNELICWAYGLNPRQIERAPGWLATEHFDMDGLPEAGVKPTREQYRAMVQTALAERFSLKFRLAEKTMPVYVLSVANNGLKAVRTTDETAKASWGVHRGWLSIQNMPWSETARVMQRTIFDRPVLDATGLSGRFSFVLKWRADETQFAQMQGIDMPEESGTADVEDIYTASRRQLGITIEAKRAPAPVMEIEAVSRPSAN